jgi:hypothetical protein
MEGLVAIGNHTPSLAVPPPPGSVSNTTDLYDIAKQTGYAIVSAVAAGITTFYLNKLWKWIKARRNTSGATPTPSGIPELSNPELINISEGNDDVIAVATPNPPPEGIALPDSSSPRSSTPTGPTE